ncbi:MAG: hypothetical protein ACRC7N_10610, partial [Clostridium sp.]
MMTLKGFLSAWFKPKSIGSSETIVAELKKEIYFKELATSIAISYIASAISKCQIKTYEDNKEVKLEDYYTLNISANVNESASCFWHKVIEKMFREQEALVIEINGKLYCADSFGRDKYPIRGDVYNGVVIDGLQLNKQFNANEVFLFKLSNNDINKLFDGLYESYSDLIAYSIKSYKKSNSLKYKLKISGVKAGDENFNKEYEEIISKQLKTFLESDLAAYPEFEGYELVDISPKSNMKNVDDITTLKKDIFETAAQSFKL